VGLNPFRQRGSGPTPEKPERIQQAIEMGIPSEVTRAPGFLLGPTPNGCAYAMAHYDERGRILEIHECTVNGQVQARTYARRPYPGAGV
jgi:hypothetical protein